MAIELDRAGGSRAAGSRSRGPTTRASPRRPVRWSSRSRSSRRSSGDDPRGRVPLVRDGNSLWCASRSRSATAWIEPQRAVVVDAIGATRLGRAPAAVREQLLVVAAGSPPAADVVIPPRIEPLRHAAARPTAAELRALFAC